MAGPAQAWLGRVVMGPAEFPIELGIFTPANRKAEFLPPGANKQRIVSQWTLASKILQC
jgi:hypothetical protein